MREPNEERKAPPKSLPRKAPSDDDREARERSRADSLAEENPLICRGID